MNDNRDYIELVKKAQLGDKECLNRLAEAATVRLREYVQRLTLQEDLTEDIVQESILEMFKVFDKLKKTDRFWSWLDGIAFNKVRSHYGRQWRHKTVSLSDVGCEIAGTNSPDGLADMVTTELKQIVVKSMRRLQPRHRAVLTMRCYRGMKYSEIAKLMNCSEFGVQALFYRAKKALAKELSRYGFGKGTLLTALVIFGKMTATSEASAASVSVTAATTKVGLAAGLVGMVASKTAVVSLTTAGVLAVGTLVATSGTDKAVVVSGERPTGSSYVTAQAVQASKGNAECWYYYPPNANGAVMMRFKSGADGKQSYCQWLQNDQANYYKHKNTMYINNYRMWAGDLTVRRLPTDSPQLTDFLSQVEGKTEPLEYVRSDGGGLLVIVKQDENSGYSQITHRYDASNEEYFRYNRLAGAKTIDNRDAMHKRGWTYFRITGRIDGEQVQGTGRIPFVYATSKRYYPWLRLKLGEKEIVDGGDGRLFEGFGRPWMGLHTIDTVRRDAAEQRIRFETGLLAGGDKAEITLTHNRSKLIYTIDMETDVIDKIDFLSDNGRVPGELVFSYLQDIDSVGNEFKPPGRKSYRGPQRKDPGMLWLVRLAEGNLISNSN